MSISIIFSGMIVFAAILLLHIVVWRWMRPRSEIKWLLALFYGLPALLLAGYLLAPAAGGRELVRPVDLFSLSVLYVSMAGVYIQIYPALTCDIPSFKILKAVHAAGAAGLSRAEIERLFGGEELVDSRIDLIKKDGLVESAGQGLKLTAFGDTLAGGFILYRRICGLGVGKG